jgi:hypothetical protein
MKMLDKNEVATLESLIRRMTLQHLIGLEVWLNGGHNGHGNWVNDTSLWTATREAEERVHWSDE